MKFQLLLLGAIAAVTVGAVSLAGSVPTASISPDRSSLASQSTGVSKVPAEVAAVPPTGTPAVVAPDTTSTVAVAPPAAEPAATPELGAIPATCVNAIQVVQAGRGRRPFAKSNIASVIADCISLRPSVVAPGKSQQPGDQPED